MAKNIKARADDYAQWYLDVIKAAQLADYSPVKGCMVIRPEGYAMWEAIQRDLDRRFKDTGHVNAYFPLLIPTSFPGQGGGARRGLRHGVRGRDALAPREEPRRQGAARRRASSKSRW